MTVADRKADYSRADLSSDDLKGLSGVPLFAGFSPNDLRKLLDKSSVRVCAPHTMLFSEGDPADCFYVVLEGWVKLFRLSENGQEIVIEVVSTGESFAEAAIFASQDFPVSAETVTPARLVKINAKGIKDVLRDNIDLTFNMLSALSRHMRRNINLLHQLSAMTTVERLALFLLGFCPNYSGESRIQLPIDKSLIAARLGMQPETFSRTIKKLQAYGVNCNGGEVHIRDVAELRAQAGKIRGKYC